MYMYDKLDKEEDDDDDNTDNDEQYDNNYCL